MKNLAILSIFLLIFLVGCNKETEIVTIAYKLNANAVWDTADFIVRKGAVISINNAINCENTLRSYPSINFGETGYIRRVKDNKTVGEVLDFNIISRTDVKINK
jgi:hypothetical protein